MSEKLCTNTDGTSSWIRKESKRRPNNFYLFNVHTGESKWDGPASKDDTKLSGDATMKSPSKSKIAASPVPSFESKERKISPKSRDVKKSKMPTPDCVKNITLTKQSDKKDIVNSIKKESVPHLRNIVKSKSTSSVQVRLDSIPKKCKDTTAKSKTSKAVPSHKRLTQQTTAKNECKSNDGKRKEHHLAAATEKQNKISKQKQSKHKTPAQGRLMDLQRDLVREQLARKTDSGKSTLIHDSVDAVDSIDATEPIDDDIELKAVPVLEPSIAPVPEPSKCAEDEAMDWEPLTDSSNAVQSADPCPVNRVFVVPDTNIFLSSLVCVKDAIEREPNHCVKVPYMVLQELDKLKNKKNDTVSQMAIRAIAYIFEKINDKNECRVTGQSANEDSEHLIDIQCPDDKILNCCLQLKEKGCDVLLLSNDKNLSIKAKVNHVDVHTSRFYNEKYDNNEDR